MPNSFRCFCRASLFVLLLGATNVHAQNDAVSRRAAIEGMYPVMLGALQAKNFGRARNICDQAIMWEPQNPVHHYNLACIEAQAGGARLPYAWGALELAIALGFDDADHLKTDPDLVPLHSDPKFADLVRKVTFNVSAGAAIASLSIPEPRSKPAPADTPVLSPELPMTASFQNDLPVGLYFMTRYVGPTQSTEKSVWYFAPDGKVFCNLEHGFSQADLAAHAGPRGKLSRGERSLEIEWAAGKPTRSRVERDGDSFTWDTRIFAAIVAFEDANEASGVYDCVDSLPSGSGATVPQRLDLRADGTFRWDGVSLVAGNAPTPTLKSGHHEATTGRWEVSGFSLRLTSSEGVVLRRFVFPSDDEKTVIKPDRMYFGGMIYKRRP